MRVTKEILEAVDRITKGWITDFKVVEPEELTS